MNAANRSSVAEVRNPVLGLPGFAVLESLPPESKHALRVVLLDIRAHARQKAEQSWRANKAPMAAYWKVVSVWAGHIARTVR